MDIDPRRSQSGAYTSPPKIRTLSAKLVPVGAGVAAAAVGLVWLLAPGFRTSQAPASAPAASPAAEPPPAALKSAPAAAVAVAARPAAEIAPAAPPVAARAQTEGAVEGVKARVARPAWANAKASQAWQWPRHLSIRNDEGTINRKLIGWYPANPAAKRMLYLLTVDRVETRLYEDEIAAFEARLAAEAEARRLEEEEAARKAEEAATAAAAAAAAEAAANREREEALLQAQARRGPETPPAAAVVPAKPAAPGKPAPAKRRPTAIRGAPARFQAAPGAFQARPQFEAAPPSDPRAPADAAIALAAVAAAGARPFKESAELTAALKDIRAAELKELQKAKGAFTSRDVTVDGGRRMAELTYADGRSEVVPYDPLVFDLKGTGIKTSPKKVLFDLYGYGKGDKTQWMNDLDEGTGILVFDASGSGSSGKNGGEVFGDRTDLTGVGQPTGFANGFAALNALVLKAVDAGVLNREVLDNGILDASALAALEKAYGLKIKPGGFNRKAVSLASAGVKSIALSLEPVQRAQDFDGQSNDLVVQPGAVFLRTDGTTGSYMNVWLKAKLGSLGLTTVNHLNPR